jgi:hypothetical protein
MTHCGLAAKKDDAAQQSKRGATLMANVTMPDRYSITSSAVASSVSGMVRPRALAVLRLIASVNLVACTTGRSAGLAPLICDEAQEIVDDGLVLVGDGPDPRRQREHDVEVRDAQQFGLALLQPCARLRALALGTMPIAARVVGDVDIRDLQSPRSFRGTRVRAAQWLRPAILLALLPVRGGHSTRL